MAFSHRSGNPGLFWGIWEEWGFWEFWEDWEFWEGMAIGMI